MLTELLVENLGPIATAEIVLQPGSSALTGETGAGKTLLVTAVALLTGGRADRGSIRDGATEARVEGRFVVREDDPVVEMLHSRDLLDTPGEEVEIVVSRTIGSSGSRARVNGRLVPVGVLAELGPSLVEIAGQHEHHRLASPREQRAILDSFTGPETAMLADHVAADVRALARIERELVELNAGERERARELDVLQFEIKEIEAAGLQPGETEQLAAEATRLEHAEELEGAIDGAMSELGGDGGAEERVATAHRMLERAVATDPGLTPIADRLGSLAVELRDIAGDLAGRVQEPDPAALETVRERIAAIAHLRRKYGDDEAQIFDYLARSKQRAEELEGKTTSAGELETEAKTIRARAMESAQKLSTERRAAAPRLAAAMEKWFAQLAMPGATFEVVIDEAELYEGGLDAVAFHIATGPGEKPRPMTKIASGGELSRIALALHLVAKDSKPHTVVFDEVDAGVGGAAAREVGAALARLGRDGAQVLVVTHLPQVAAFSDAHYRVRRGESKQRGVKVEKVEGDDRVEELSRMLAGLPESERAREHAQELLDLAAAGTG